jgi:polyisoprenoid-binding protein YceI
MSRNAKIIVGVVVVAIGVLGLIGLYNFFLGETEAASGPVTAIPLTEAVVEQPIYPPPTAEGQSAEAPYPEPEVPAEQAGGAVVYTIDQENSEVRFVLGEILQGAPKEVVGISNQVAGQISVDMVNPGNSQVGVITINARTLETDADRRNQAIRNRILFTDDYEFITFTPTGINGLPESTVEGETISFQIEGDLTIRDITQTVVFDVTAVVASGDRLEGSASTTIARADYNLSIPSVPAVADVDEEVRLEIDFVAIPG